MIKVIRLGRDEKGAAAVEFALAVPVLITFIYGIAQIGMVLAASAGMQHALGEAARLGTLCVNLTATGCGVPTDAELAERVTATVYGTGNGDLSALSITPSTSTAAGNNFRDLSLTYSQPTNFIFFSGPTVTIRRSKRVWLAT